MDRAIKLPLPALMLNEIAASLAAGESRAGFIRKAIMAEIFRRHAPPIDCEAAE